MSGHSHFKTIKHKKESEDKKRGKIFSKMARLISIAAREKGKDPETNPELRMAIEKAKQHNVPKENIERAIKKGTGELAGAELKEVIYEAYAPGGVAIIIEAITDNKNRTLNEIKQILSQHEGKLAQEGSVKYLFERKGIITIDTKNNKEKKESLELKAIESGAEDIIWYEDFFDVITGPKNLEKIKNNLEKKEIKIKESGLEWVAKNMVKTEEKDKKICEKIFEDLNDHDDVQEIYSNLK